MANEKNNASFFTKLATVIVDKRNILFIIYIAAFIFSLIAQNWVKVCDDITAYLPADMETRQGLTVMEDEFVTYSTARIMIANITYDKAEALCDKLKELPQVNTIDFDDTEDYYKDGCALFAITLKGQPGDSVTDEGYAALREAVSGYDAYISESDADMSDTLDGEMNMVLGIAAVIIVAVLLFTSQTYMEVPALLLTFVAAAILNKGSNYWFGEISFVSNSVTVVLQLALSIDYAIIMIHHYSEERQMHDQREAVICALAKSIPEISASSLTTVSGLLALMFMQFRIGFDLGLCLIKSIVFSLLCVFTLMPCLLMVLGKYIDKTHHKSFLPNVSALGSFVYKLRYIVPPIFVAALVLAFLFSSKCPYVYDANSSDTQRHNEMQIAKTMINETFGQKNLTALVIPAGDYNKQKQLTEELEALPQVESVTALTSVKVKDEYVLTDSLTPRQFAELTDIDIELSKLVYIMYAADHEDYGKIISNLDSFGVPLIDMFMFVYDLKTDGYVEFDDDMNDTLDDLYIQLDSARKQLSGPNYSRMLVYLDLPMEGDETFSFLDTIHEVADKYYDTVYLVGDATSSYDLEKTFATDNIIVSVLSVLFVILVLFFTFKSAGLPVLLIAVIQGSVWLNFSMPYITKKPIFFMSYLIVSSIQMGANIDYAIVISSRYMELKKSLPIKKAMRGTLNFAFPTVFTSGSILASAGFLIGKLSTDPTVVSIGSALCNGTLISMFLVMLVLPEILLLGDTIIEKTKFSIKKPELIQHETGRFFVNGRVRGYINGFVDADIHGMIRGKMEAQVNINNVTRETEALTDGHEDDEE